MSVRALGGVLCGGGELVEWYSTNISHVNIALHCYWTPVMRISTSAIKIGCFGANNNPML